MSFRDDMNALYARAEALERDLERANAEVAELRGQRSSPAGSERGRTGPSRWSSWWSGTSSAEGTPSPPPAVEPREALEFLERLHARNDPPALTALQDYEETIGRAIELVVPELLARRRGLSGDGSVSELQATLDFLVALWRDHASGQSNPTGQRWQVMDRVIRGWAAHNELRRVLEQLNGRPAPHDARPPAAPTR